MFKFFKSKVKKISNKFLNFKASLGSKIKNLFSKRRDDSCKDDSCKDNSCKDNSFYDALEQILYEADLGVFTTTELIKKIKKSKIKSFEDTIALLKEELQKKVFSAEETQILKKPHVIMVVGVNGSGKTTSIAKLANYYKEKNKKVLIAAADTFRAAAVEQLASWAQKIDVDIIKSQKNSDPAAVVFDALAAAKARDVDIVLIDTAGRLQNKTELMHELGKINRICKKQIEDAPHEIYLTLDATTGQNAVDQAEIFNKFVPINGIVLSKLDSTSKGGIIVAIQEKTRVPVIWCGTGEKLKDLTFFDPDIFIEELLSCEE